MLRFVVALEPEARPLIERYRLRREPDAHPFAIYRREGIALVVSGIGKVAAAAATSYLHLATGGERHAAWLNVGIAGHRQRPLGEAVIAHKIRDAASGRSWYPPRIASAESSDEVVTVDRPETELREPVAYEMEASGFYDTASRFASSEVVQCLKIVSDSPSQPAADLTPRKVAALVERRLPAVERLAQGCLELSAELRRLEAEPPDFDRCLERWYFTVTEKRQLSRLLRRRRTLAPAADLPLEDLGARARGKDVNRRLGRWLDAVAVEAETA
ncbi:MAG: hypothetical protein V3T72_11325 [Thermoanaerobaculia bacterium]